jgi:hypothetical protein
MENAMATAFVSTVDRAVLTETLQETLGRLRQIQEIVDPGPDVLVPDADWLEIYDVLDRVKDQRPPVIRPVPRMLFDAYVRTPNWLRELHPRLREDPADSYGRKQLAAVIVRLERDLIQHYAL